MASPEDFELPADGIDLRKAVQAFEMSLIDQALERTGFNQSACARLLGITRYALRYRMEKYELKS